jgi:hypothetical protein
MAPHELEAELKTYQKHRDELLAHGEGKFALIHAARVLGTYESQKDAVEEGYRQLGHVPFLVKQVLAVETPLYFTSNLIGV